MEISKEYLAWLAGFFDGEGSISIGVYYHKIVKPPFRQKGYHLRLTIAQNVKEVLEEIRLYFGGCLKLKKSKYVNIQRPMYDLCFDCLKAQTFLKAIYPYLKVKRKQAEIALKFQYMLNTIDNASIRREHSAVFKQELEAINNSKVWIV